MSPGTVLTTFSCLNEMPEVYSVRASQWVEPQGSKPGFTCVLAPSSEATIFGASKEVRFGNIVDGTSNTLFAIEVDAASAVPWTAPRDYEFEAANPGVGLSRAGDGCVALMADGSVHFLPIDLPAETLRRLFEMNDGEVVDW